MYVIDICVTQINTYMEFKYIHIYLYIFEFKKLIPAHPKKIIEPHKLDWSSLRNWSSSRILELIKVKSK